MAALRWDPASLKTHFRVTTQRLGQLQAKLDSYGNITRKDIATLLQQGNVGLARAKAQKLIQEDFHGDLLEIMEMEVATLLEHFNELDANEAPTALLSEAIASIIYAAPHVQCRELDQVRSTLIQRFGPDFARSATTNRENHVPQRVLRTLNPPLPSATHLNRYLLAVARNYHVNWVPDPERHDIVNVLSELLNSQVSEEIDLARLRKLCAYGLPDEPSWLRPRIWKLFFGILPPKQSEWASEITKQRDCYYDLVKRLLKPYASIEDAEETESEALDEALMNIFKHISRIPRDMFSHLDQAPEALSQCPVSSAATPDIEIDCAFALDERLKTLRENDTSSEAGAGENDPTPGIAISDFDEEDDSDSEAQAPQTLVHSKLYSFGNAHPTHCSALLRLLFIHASINPGKLSPHVPAVLVPLYSALLQEVEPEELAHAEADTFWLFEAIVSEISELDEDEGGEKWMAAFDRVTAWADPELHADLELKGLHPAVPHYSYRWLAPLLTYTIPVPSIFLIWDAIFARLPRAREDNFKLSFLVDIASGMLIALRKPLLSLGHPSASSLWNDEGLAPELSVRELNNAGDAFLEGISMLQAYPLKSVGEVERIIQIANDLGNRRESEKKAAETAQTNTWGATLRTTMWKGFTNQVDNPEDSPPTSDPEPDARDDGNETERPQSSQSSGFNLTSVLGGLRAKAPPVPPKEPTASAEQTQVAPPAGPAAGFWNYAEKLKDSDTVATLAKVGTNWRARAVSVSWGRNTTPAGNIGEIHS